MTDNSIEPPVPAEDKSAYSLPKDFPFIHIQSLTFSDSQKLEFDQGDVVVLVGPNNAGKSLCLREIKYRLSDIHYKTFAIKNVEYSRNGSFEELENWLTNNSLVTDKRGDPVYGGYGYNVRKSTVVDRWNSAATGLTQLTDLFCVLLSADERLKLANPPDNIKRTSQPPTHPIHYLYKDDKLADEVSKQFRKAFGQDLIVHYAAGNEIPLHTGEAPVKNEKRDRVSAEYIEDLEKLPRLDKQGDGMRSFAGILLHSTLMGRSINLIDEPEAFLHPPQARLLGQMLIAGRKLKQQLFIATHSRDVLHGVLDSNSSAVRVIRIQREGDINKVSELNNEDLKKLWSDPLLRYSNVLSGVFHEHVVLCESDGDCRFYQAIADALYEESESAKQPDVLFIHCGGKQRMPQIIKALRGLNVPISIAPDFDVLNNDKPLKDIIESYDLNWSDFEKDWKIIKSNVDQAKPELKADEVKRDIATILAEVTTDNFPKDKVEAISKTLRRSSPWAVLKQSGKAGLPSGDAAAAYVRLDSALRSNRIYIPPVGELERFCPSVGDHGPKWVNQILERDLKNDPELEDARKFVSAIFAGMKEKVEDKDALPAAEA